MINWIEPFSINGILLAPNPIIERGKGIKTDSGAIIMHPFDIAIAILQSYKDYSIVFDKMGINDATLDACVFYAKQKLQNK